ncbi:radical SAM family heme chaperone HemW [Ferruginibacter albus]|uniref:radical SAM family heme chaperone HemW n=1 Tax=Ferruginibacter albus TaxID=2875540 RepID=UPI001CC6E7D9|nr:radical SAM family heme chaperone HemW [Ferruginibacter albus]UAY51710.1 radical SAM family heme chaperone HemW [Ferruginibacter albus]
MSGIYIHIPFCKQACNYCNFHFSTSLKQKQAFIDALLKEIDLTSPYSCSEKIETIYLGGGTPSILDIDDITRIFEALNKKFLVTVNAEITLEANPDDITSNKLKDWKKAGINRLSVGIQSFFDEELKWMNRAHNANESLVCIDTIMEEGFTNFSIDLIYGSPLLSNDGWKRNVEIVIEKNIPHISCYALTVEPKTALDKLIATKKSLPTDSEKQAGQFLLLMNWMHAAGYEHYEISNFAKPGMRSKHNSSYWQGKNYYGFGPSAHSYNGKTRRWNIANNSFYIDSINKNIIPFEEEILSKTQQLNEYIMTSLRTIEGLDLNFVKDKFGEEAKNKLQIASKKYESKLKFEDQQLILTNEGKLFADGIAADLFETES